MVQSLASTLTARLQGYKALIQKVEDALVAIQQLDRAADSLPRRRAVRGVLSPLILKQLVSSPKTPAQLAGALHAPVQTVSTNLYKLRAQRKVQNSGGLWALRVTPPSPAKPAKRPPAKATRIRRTSEDYATRKQAITDFIQKAGKPLTAREIYDGLHKPYTRVETIYGPLNDLKEAHVLRYTDDGRWQVNGHANR